MPTQTSMLHVRVDNHLKSRAHAVLADMGLTLSDAVRILLTRVVAEGGLPVGLTSDPVAYDRWFRDKVHEALHDETGDRDHDEFMAAARSRLTPPNHD
ncbi:type II toxin-antitoxin system RelB/DinJ family antitoxin [Woodsholea maritima]|uniref:type II toxin-antitoxin system RelB/DinJ family antitoxin n=1 Tax=Woodsholea maritima TaxID=240237 RepID=UPI0003766820|nr:type II toxin-antitoxin system RelB/DinJ family antitoxin [Woodsholea maritima]